MVPLLIPACGNGEPTVPVAETEITLDPVAAGLGAPLALVELPDGAGRLLVADQGGLLRLIADDELDPVPFLDLRDRLVGLGGGGDERGLLGVAAHPDFDANGRVFVYYSAPLRAGAPANYSHTSRVSEFVVGADPNRADPSSERVIIEIDEPQANHNAGAIAFGPDGYLYIALGDGGGANDSGTGHVAGGNGQDATNLLGSILRIDVDGQQPYAVPADNPFVDDDRRDEVWAYGFRNPYRFGFDLGTGDLIAGDAGQRNWEEVDLVTRGGNYGWRLREGRHCFDPNNPADPPDSCPTTGAGGEPLIDPVLEYANGRNGGLGYAVIGGFVYRGSAIPDLIGQYLFGDYTGTGGDGRLFLADTSPAGPWTFSEIELDTPSGSLGRYLLGFGQDLDGEIYVLSASQLAPNGSSGRVDRLAAR